METLPQLPMVAVPRPGRRFKLGPVCVASLLLLLAAGFGLLARAMVPNTPVTHTTEEGTQTVRESSLPEILAHPEVIPSHRHALLGRQAPDFELADSEGTLWNLAKLRDGHPVVLIFYYGFHCLACVRHLVEINRDLPLFREVGARVVAISADPPELTRQWFQQHGTLGFTVLSDPGNQVAKAYRIFRGPDDGQSAAFLRHGTFLIDGNGKVQWVNVGDAPFRHDPALLYQLAKMEGRLPAVLNGP